MAVDEAMFRMIRHHGVTTLRLYGWRRPSVSTGRFQNQDDEVDMAACRRHDIAVVRRPTGGKAVYHDDEVTYAVVGREDGGFFPADILGTYRVISTCIADALRLLGITAEMAPWGRGGAGDLGSSCFAVPSRFELLTGERKICGSAQVRSRGAFLQHGSLLMRFDAVMTYETLLPKGEPRDRFVQRLREGAVGINEVLPRPVTRQEVCDALRDAFARFFGVVWREEELMREEEMLKEQLLARKYNTEGLEEKGDKG
ncbi:MAG: lipoate--protein ligase family protein [Syntrophales bacterium]|nr:lipoate--protein ligase family protein [Syntrophales bacterium]